MRGVAAAVDHAAMDHAAMAAAVQVITRVATEILDELDYEKEAQNGAAFEESLGFLGYVTTPVVRHEYSTTKVLVTEWVQGEHLSKLSPEAGLRMTRMAVEACTASLVLTGYVHADPHEGNLMLADDGRVIFLDFGRALPRRLHHASRA